MTDQQLMKAVGKGDPAATGELVDLFQKRVFRFLLGWIQNREDALDITQEVLLRVCRKADSYDGSAPLAAWVFRIARNLYTDHRRRKNFKVYAGSVRYEDAVMKPGLRQAGLSPEVQLEKRELFSRVGLAIKSLPPRQREVVQLRLLAELRLEEIAQAAGLSLGGVKSTLHAALRNLRNRLEDLEKDAYVNL